MKPIIGITVEPRHEPGNSRTSGTLKLNWNYAEVITEVGGVPILIPPTAPAADVARLIDGWLIPGGHDIDAAFFGEKNDPNADIQDPARFLFERALYEAIDPRMPILGICYGCQFLNVVRGGTLVQHIPDIVDHDRHAQGVMETLEVTGGTKLSDIFGDTACGRSFHHQAIGRLGEDVAVTARSSDGIIEAIEAQDRPWVVAVQWHPERTLDIEGNRELLRRFVSAAQDYAGAKRAT